MRNDYLKFCFENSIRAYIAPKISDIIIRGADDIRLFDTPLLLCRNYGLDFEQRLFKRTFDIVFSLVALVPALPFMLVSAIAIKLYDGGPVLYKQVRLTTNGRRFYVYKFRSMIVDAEKNGVPQLCTDEDSRITPVGRFLRKCRLDELPQLFNVLKGDMSIIGPRPPLPREVVLYTPHHMDRLLVKGGLSCICQTEGRSDMPFEEWVDSDIKYIENRSAGFDLKLMFKTVSAVLLRKGAK